MTWKNTKINPTSRYLEMLKQVREVVAAQLEQEKAKLQELQKHTK